MAVEWKFSRHQMIWKKTIQHGYGIWLWNILFYFPVHCSQSLWTLYILRHLIYKTFVSRYLVVGNLEKRKDSCFIISVVDFSTTDINILYSINWRTYCPFAIVNAWFFIVHHKVHYNFVVCPSIFICSFLGKVYF